MFGLHPVIYQVKHANVMLKMNLWPSVGLCNGATGIVIDIVYQTGNAPPSLPNAVIVKSDGYRGPSFSDQESSLVPIWPVTIKANLNAFHERQQLPLRLAWAFTIKKKSGNDLVTGLGRHWQIRENSLNDICSFT